MALVRRGVIRAFFRQMPYPRAKERWSGSSPRRVGESVEYRPQVVVVVSLRWQAGNAAEGAAREATAREEKAAFPLKLKGALRGWYGFVELLLQKNAIEKYTQKLV